MGARSLFDRLYSPERAARVAVLYEHRAITYAELHDQTVGVSEALNALRVGAGDRVAILLNDSPEFIASFVAIISLGAIAVPVNLALRREDQLFILKDCGACAAIAETSIVKVLFGGSNAPAELKHLIVVRRDRDSTIPEIDGMKMQELEHANRQPLAASPGANENADSFILYTSGSTGEPKGAVHRQTDIFYTNETFCRAVLRLRAGDRSFSSSRLPYA